MHFVRLRATLYMDGLMTARNKQKFFKHAPPDFGPAARYLGSCGAWGMALAHA